MNKRDEKREIRVGKTTFCLMTNFSHNKTTEKQFIAMLKRLLLQEIKRK